jgi:hypothetical protein
MNAMLANPVQWWQRLALRCRDGMLWGWLSSAYCSGRPPCTPARPTRNISAAQAFRDTWPIIAATAIAKADRNGALGRWSPSIPRGIKAAAVTAALATCSLFFALTVFAQPASDPLEGLPACR